MNKEELVEFLKNNLRLEIEDVSGAYCPQYDFEVRILLGGKVITKDRIDTIEKSWAND